MASSFSPPRTSISQSPNYDVFINHRGIDVKKTFASHLYRWLVSHGLTVFLDREVLQVGQTLTSQIQHAIRNASVHVAIFSERYAESSWCLKELLLMLHTGKPIIPVFYHVTPSDLRWTQDAKYKYTQALRNLEMKKISDSQTHEQGKLRYNSTTIQNWRDALSTVADICGLDLDAEFNGSELYLLLISVFTISVSLYFNFCIYHFCITLF